MYAIQLLQIVKYTNLLFVKRCERSKTEFENYLFLKFNFILVLIFLWIVFFPQCPILV